VRFERRHASSERHHPCQRRARLPRSAK
jgi:hypothetical protein